MNHEVRFSDEGIHFEAYPFLGASVYPNGLLKLADIRDIDPQDHPPSLRKRDGEVLFLPASCREELKRWMAHHNLPPYPHDMVHARRAESFPPPPREEEIEAEAADDGDEPEAPIAVEEEVDDA